MKKIFITILLPFFLWHADLLSAQISKPTDAADLQLEFSKLSVLGSVLYIGAHPDDENTALLAFLAKERLLRTAYLSITRGDGGQNLLGIEKSELLGVIRTQELLAARKIDGAEQFFTRAIDFGYSKSSQETMDIWGKKMVLADMVWIIRSFQPDVVITRFPDTGDGGHGHHIASGILAREACAAAANAGCFAEQLEQVAVWQPKRLLWNCWRPAGQSDNPADSLIQLDVGVYNPLLGQSYTEIAAESRSMHKSQGFGSAERRGTRIEYFKRLSGEPASRDLMDGVETSWLRIPGSADLARIIARASSDLIPAKPQAGIPALLKAFSAINKLPKENRWVPIKRQELLEVIRNCAGIWLKAIAADERVVPGNRTSLSAELVNRSEFPFILEKIIWPFVKTDTLLHRKLADNQPIEIKTVITVPADLPYTHPYWLREKPARGYFSFREKEWVGMPESPPPIQVGLSFLADDQRLDFSIPVMYRSTDPVLGESYRSLIVSPPVTVNFKENQYIFCNTQPKKIEMIVRNSTADIAGTLRLVTPQGWQAAPAFIPFVGDGEDRTFSFTLFPLKKGTFQGAIHAVVRVGEQEFSCSHIAIHYPHIQQQNLFPPAEARLLQLDVLPQKMKIGYIMGSGDEIPDCLRQIGYTVTLLSDEILSSAHLSVYDVIIVGVRAYNTRTIFRSIQKKLNEYMMDGGTLIVQYQNNNRLIVDAPGPFTFKISRERVTDENAPLTLLHPSHPLLCRPNRITLDDFSARIQERGLYFSDQWDEKYEIILACHDPGEKDLAGGMLYARFGKGVYIFTAYSWFRQLPACVPGAYRLFVNMIQAGK